MFKLTAALVLSTVALSDAVTEYRVGCFGLFGCMASTLFSVYKSGHEQLATRL